MTTWKNQYPISTFPEGTQKELIEFIEGLLKKDTPMGVSKWLDYGIKYGYDKFYQKGIEDRLIEDIKIRISTFKVPHNDYCEMLEKYSVMPCDCGVEQYNMAINEVVNYLNKQEETKDCQCEACMRDMPDCCLMVK